jgi:hypothetical protein
VTWIHWDEREHAQEPLGQSQGPSVSMGARHGRRSSRLRQRSQTTHWLAEEPQTLDSRLEVSFQGRDVGWHLLSRFAPDKERDEDLPDAVAREVDVDHES